MASDLPDETDAPLTDNPLLSDWDAPFGLPPFERIRPSHFEPALREAMRAHRAELVAIAAQEAAPSFDNTVAAFDRAGRLLGRVEAVMVTLATSATGPELQAVQRAMAAPLAAHGSAVYMDAGVFARVDALWGRRAMLALTPQAARMLERTRQDFVRAGALLAPAARARYAQVMQDLAQLTTRFAHNVLHDETRWALELRGEDELAGLPDTVRAAARQAAVERGLGDTGVGGGDVVHAITLARSLVVPFLTFSTRADLRRQVWSAWVERGANAGERDNRGVARDILRLRREQAALHGRGCFADHALADTMAGGQGAVQRLLGEVWTRALQAVQGERAQLLQAMAAAGQSCADGQVEPWDWRFWAERVRRERYAVDDAEVKPYFALERVVEAAFDCAQRLFGLHFTPRAGLPVYHPDVRAYEVTDEGGCHVGVFMQDNFARATKRSGAWMSALRWQALNVAPGQAAQTPVILNNSNFVRAAPGEPTLLSLEDVRTLFHEFGHALHGLLSQVDFERLSGTQVLRDFVELPSQIFEHWITEPEVLQRHARHWRTGEPIPLALIERMQRARRFGQGYETVRYCASALVDMAVHALPDAEPPADLCAFEAGLLRSLGLPHGVGLNHRLVHFQHLFASSGYAAGYYVYLWAEVLADDGYNAFGEAGSPFDAAVAARLRQHIYGSGDSVEPGAAYRAFRGRDATVGPLLRKRGLEPVEG